MVLGQVRELKPGVGLPDPELAGGEIRPKA